MGMADEGEENTEDEKGIQQVHRETEKVTV
jgi:hypothetical protein